MTSFEKWWLDAWPHRLEIRRLVPRFLRACPDPFRGEVLEVGSGNGWTSRSILETFPQVELTATDREMRGYRRFGRLQSVYGQRLKFKQADLLELPFDRSSFDMVVAINVLHQIDDIHLAVQQFLRVLRPGGLIGVAGGNGFWLRGWWSKLFSKSLQPKRKNLENLLRQEGCQLLKTRGDGHYYVWARKPYG